MTKCNSCGSWTELQRHGEFRCKRCYHYKTHLERKEELEEELTEKRVLMAWRGWEWCRHRYEDRVIAKMTSYERSLGPYKISYPPALQRFTYRPKNEDDKWVFFRLKSKATFGFFTGVHYRGYFTVDEEKHNVEAADSRANERNGLKRAFPPLWERSKSSLRGMGVRAPRPVAASSQAIKQ